MNKNNNNYLPKMWRYFQAELCRVWRVVVSSDESKLKPVIVFYPRFCNVWFKEYLFSTRGEACKSKKSINCLCFILSFYYNVLLLEEMLKFVERSLTENLWIRGNKNFVFFVFFLYFSISLLLQKFVTKIYKDNLSEMVERNVTFE